MSDYSLTLVLQFKTSKIINDMANIQQKSEKISALGGIFFVLDKIDRILSSVIDSHLGLRSRLIGYQYSEIIRAGTTSGWSNDDYKCFIDFYKAIDFPSFCRIQKKYAPKTAHNTIFLILYEMGMDDKAVRRIMGITQEAIRSTRYRILTPKGMRSIRGTVPLYT